MCEMNVGVVVTSSVDGGGERYLRDLYEGLRERGISGHLLGDVPRWNEIGLPATSLGFGEKWSRRSGLGAVARIPRDIRHARSAAAHHRVDLFHMQYKREQLTLTRTLSHVAPIIWTEHGILPAGMAGGVLAYAYRRAAAHVSAIVCVSDVVRAQIADLCKGFDTRVETIENAVDISRFRPPSGEERARARLRLRVHGPVVCVVSRLHRAKRVELAIDAMRYLNGASLLIAGTGPERFVLEARAAGLPVVFVGHVADVRDVLHSSDVCVFPTSGASEGFPLAILEAAACGVPFVATLDSGLTEVTSAAGGVIAEPRPEDIALAIASLLDEDHRHVVRRWAEAHDVDRWLSAHAQLFRNVAAGCDAADASERLSPPEDDARRLLGADLRELPPPRDGISATYCLATDRVRLDNDASRRATW
jgi:glycosyltransferase involved in cell wall biosynthesis